MIRSRLQRPVPVLALGLLCLTAAAAPPPPGSRELDPSIADRLPRTDVPELRRVCAEPFENRGTFGLPVRTSGAGAASEFIPGNRYLEIRQVRASLRGPGLWAGDLGVSVSGDSGWYGMRLVNDAVVWTASADGPLYADRGSRITFVAYRNSGTDRAVTGDYVIRGCLVEQLPLRITRPDIEVPRLPKKRLTPREPVEILPLRRPAVRTGG